MQEVVESRYKYLIQHTISKDESRQQGSHPRKWSCRDRCLRVFRSEHPFAIASSFIRPSLARAFSLARRESDLWQATQTGTFLGS